MIAYNPKDWYWFVAGDTSEVYSSKLGDFVLVSNPGYLAWVGTGGAPSNIASVAELGEVLAPYNLRPSHAATLDGYTEAQASKLTLEIVAKILFWTVNEIRVLKGQQPVKANQFKTFLKGLM